MTESKAIQEPIVRVALDVPLPGLFDYRALDLTHADIGRRVVVPFGKRWLAGVVWELASESMLPPDSLKPVRQRLDDVPALPVQLFDLVRFCASYYQYPLGPTLFTALPALLRRSAPCLVAAPSGWRVTAAGRQQLPQALPVRAPLQHAVASALLAADCVAAPSLRTLGAGAGRLLAQWQQTGWIERAELPYSPPAWQCAAGPALNDEQQQVLAQLAAEPPAFAVWLLHGITGSGKTEIYLQRVAAALADGQQILVLVPEINLTPQLVDRFQRRFPGLPLVSLHSGLNDSERARHWLAAMRGEADIVLGTRLAVFTPLPRLGLIIVDEEHDASFKQQDGLRYSARDVAIYRARQQNVPILLGSATPSLESYHHAQTGRYRYLRLTRRAGGASLPSVQCVDTRRQRLDQGLAPSLVAALQQRLQQGEQSLVFINRRGYAPVLFCADCGWAAACQRCSARLVVHLREQRLRCHHCGGEAAIPLACPDCGNQDLKPLGLGTQRLETMLAQALPQARILRIDRDSTRSKHAWDTIYRQVHAGEADILIGTQMLAKGHDFPDLSLVCVLNADVSLFSADYRATERLFSLLIQVAGRAGRGERPGAVLIQTQFPDHPLFAAVMRHDFDGYAHMLLAERRQAGFPPAIFQAVLRAEAARLDDALDFLRQAAAVAALLKTDVTVFDPVAASMQRLAGLDRAQLLVQHASRAALQSFLADWLPHLRALRHRQVRWALDVDPLDV